MYMYGINKNVYENIINYFTNNNNIRTVILFGSRAKGNEKINSDIDLCIDYTGNNKFQILEDIDVLVGIYSCDIVFKDTLSKDIKEQVSRYGVKIYEVIQE